MSNPVLVELRRGNAVESMHRGAIAVVDADGALRCALGDIERPIFPRSAVKAFQALPLLTSGAADRYGLVDEELALACASHNGEAEHVRVAAAMLAKAGLDEQALECGAHWPMSDAAARELAAVGGSPGALHNNCSGKHAGFVCLGGLLGDADRRWLAGYVRHEHPLMREVTHALVCLTGQDLERAPRGIDGCSIPTYGMPLGALARGFARFASGVGLAPEHAQAAKRLRAAVAAAPFMVAGTGRFDTRVMEALGARAFVKVGAEGVYGAALPELGLGLALKIDDGNTARAAEVVTAAAIEALLPLDDMQARTLRSLAEPRLANWNGLEVGRLAPTPLLRDALAPATRRRAAGQAEAIAP
ncbi:MAG TPA: asparaginase [Methylibium sp.]|uniref:asparaginase n=1 Tax=Methylibium sp. TaxID=2067992 RepID=UPI002DBEE2E0|nr:asparaginase [Methylibium sp.]HEU4459220.1 asparaginase [Methylibium sp.]